mmetsp:Transcript_52368/g.146059  ORF Transcript_52368/g.146059 Transcript_52368/m.146059 type:complete len:308 (+) Transcript_52368:274-1197(+)
MKQRLIFVDIDGVLNVGMKDGTHSVCLSEDNVMKAKMMTPLMKAKLMTRANKNAADRLLSVITRSLEPAGESGPSTYEHFSCPTMSNVSDRFVERLAKLIEAAGPHRHVVLSSTWRMPRYACKVEELEAAIGSRLGQPFTFDARTDLEEDYGPAGRLSGIASYVHKYCKRVQLGSRCLRILVLEDFHVTPMGAWKAGGTTMGSAQDVEAYLQSLIPARLTSAVMLLHTYDEWNTRSGSLVQIGSGLTMQHYSRAMAFLHREDAVKWSSEPCLPMATPAPAGLRDEEACDAASVPCESCPDVQNLTGY